ncbi:MAG TPA: mannose-1-phosphate guanylyltransferase [Candidatus Limnocylindria bacterium]|nr:mannose-1-phosphate guanylyltransferase [Candidatus Limnocylindria bacterium]
MYAVILAGGGGTRLWPLSRRSRPKPFLPLTGGRSLFQQTLGRLAPLVSAADTFVVAEEAQLEIVTEQAAELRRDHLIGEPRPRNTAAAVCLAALAIDRPADEVMIVLPADHLVADEQSFRQALSAAASAASDGSLVVLGINPTGPATGYGYIVGGAPAAAAARTVARFVEKPPRELAEQLLADPRGSWWNAGVFIWQRGALLASLERHAPAILKPLRDGLAAGRSPAEIYADLPAQPIDKALLEPAAAAGEVRVVPADVGWSDIGSWPALRDALVRAGARGAASGVSVAGGVVAVGRSEDLGSDGLLVHASGDRLVVTVGLRDTIVVETPDVVLVCAAEHAQEVREIVDRLADQKETDYL